MAVQKKVTRKEELIGNVGDDELRKHPLPLKAKADDNAPDSGSEEKQERKTKRKPKAELTDFLRALDEHADEHCHVTVIRVGPRTLNGRPIKLTGVLSSVPIEEFDGVNPIEIIDGLRRSVEEEHGRGTYACSLYDGNGKLRKRWGFEILEGVIPDQDYDDYDKYAVKAAAAKPADANTGSLLALAEAEQARLIEKKKLKQLERNNEKLRQEVEPDDSEPEETEERGRGQQIMDPEEIQQQAFAAGKAAAAEEFEEKAEKTAMMDMLRSLKDEIKELKTNPPKRDDDNRGSMFDKIVTLMVAAQENNTKLFTSMLQTRADQPQQQLPPVIEQLVQAAINKTIPADGAGDGPMQRAIATVSEIVGLRNSMGMPFNGGAPAEPTPWWQSLIESLSGPLSEFIAMKKLELQQAKPGATDAEIARLVNEQVQIKVAEMKAQARSVMAKKQAAERQPFAAGTKPAPADAKPSDAQQHFKHVDNVLPHSAPLPGVRTEQELPAPVAPGDNGNGALKTGIAHVLSRLQAELETCPERVTWIGECYTHLPSDVIKQLEADPTDQGLVKVLTNIANPLQLMQIANTLKSDENKYGWFNAGLEYWRQSLQQQKVVASAPVQDPVMEAQGGIMPPQDAADDEGEEGADGAA